MRVFLFLLLAATTLLADRYYFVSRLQRHITLPMTYNPYTNKQAVQVVDGFWLVNDTTNELSQAAYLNYCRLLGEWHDGLLLQYFTNRPKTWLVLPNASSGTNVWIHPDFEGRPEVLEYLGERYPGLQARLTSGEWDMFTNTARQKDYQHEKESKEFFRRSKQLPSSIKPGDPDRAEKIKQWLLEEFGKEIEASTNMLVAISTNAQGTVLFGVDNGGGDYYPTIGLSKDTFGNLAELGRLLKQVPHLEQHVDAATWFWFTNTSQATPQPAPAAKQAADKVGD